MIITVAQTALILLHSSVLPFRLTMETFCNRKMFAEPTTQFLCVTLNPKQLASLNVLQFSLSEVKLRRSQLSDQQVQRLTLICGQQPQFMSVIYVERTACM